MSTGLVLLHSFPTRPKFTPNQLAELDSIILRLIERIRNYRPLVLPHFQDFDRQHRGTVSHEQFARVLTLIKSELKADELILLTQKYLDEDLSRVDYRRFLNDVDETYTDPAVVKARGSSSLFNFGKEESKEEIIVSQNSVFTQNKDDSSKRPQAVRTVENILEDIRKHSLVQRTTLYDLFIDFDPLRHRTITRSQFRRCLDVSGFSQSISQSDIDILSSTFANSKRDVLYSEFERAVNGVFVPLDAELNPLVVTESSEQVRNGLKKRPIDVMRGSPLDVVLTRLAYISSTRRILLKPAFAAYDRHAAGCVTEAAFKSVLSLLFHTEKDLLSPGQVAVIVTHFEQGAQGISYSQFCDCVKQREREYEEQLTAIDSVSASQKPITAASKQTTNPAVTNLPSTLSQPIRSLSLLMQSLNDTLAFWRLHIDTAFDDFDRLRRGSVPKDVFYRCLSMCGLRLRIEEINLLASQYKCSDAEREGHVDYKRFLRDLSPAMEL